MLIFEIWIYDYSQIRQKPDDDYSEFEDKPDDRYTNQNLYGSVGSKAPVGAVSYKKPPGTAYKDAGAVEKGPAKPPGQ